MEPSIVGVNPRYTVRRPSSRYILRNTSKMLWYLENNKNHRNPSCPLCNYYKGLYKGGQIYSHIMPNESTNVRLQLAGVFSTVCVLMQFHCKSVGGGEGGGASFISSSKYSWCEIPEYCMVFSVEVSQVDGRRMPHLAVTPLIKRWSQDLYMHTYNIIITQWP